MASSVETPTAGFSSAQHRPLTAATPMRTPVKEPGPRATATASSADLSVPVDASRFSTIGSSVALCVRPEHWKYCPVSTPSFSSAALAALAVDSMPSISICPHLLQS